jgi:hypothetical protein
VTSCASSSSRALLLLLLLACAGARPKPGSAVPRGPVLVLPPANLAGGAAPLRELRSALEDALAQRGIAVVPHEAAEMFLSRHRIRWTGGVDGAAARAAAAELGAGSVLVSAVELYQPAAPPRIALSARLVAAGPDPRPIFFDERSRTGDESPGLFELGLIDDPAKLQAEVVAQLAGSLRAFFDGRGGAASACRGGFDPAVSYRSPLVDPAATYTVAVLPFINETRRRGAGEVLALQFARQLAASPGFRVLEQGVVREELNQYRITLDDGLSLDEARVVLELLHADFVLAGTVRGWVEPANAAGAPEVEFSAMLLDRKNSEVVWQTTSFHRGDEGAWFFDLGRVPTAPALACGMVAGAVESLRSGARNVPGAQKLRLGGGR